MMPARFSARLGLVQRVIPLYRAPFFEMLAGRCDGFSLFAGQPRPDEAISTASILTTSSMDGHSAQLVQAHNLHFLTTSSPFYFCYQSGLTNWLENWNPVGLIFEANFRYLSSPAGVGWMKQRRRPVLGWGLGAPLDRGLLSGLRLRFLQKFDAIIAYSQRGAEQYADCGIPVDKIFVAPNAVASAPVQALPQRANVFSLRPVLLFVGRLQARKRIPALLKACALLPVTLHPRLIIVGDGPEADGLHALAKEIYPQTEFVGEKHGAELDEYFLASDLFVLPGTGGLAVQQAMSWGLPVIVAQGDGTQDDLVRAANGWQIPVGDDDALASTLREALSDVSRLREMGAESYRIVAQEINLEKMVDVFVNALNTVS